MKKAILSSSFAVMLTILRSQSVDFYHSYHYNDLNYGSDIIYTSDSHYVAVGRTYSMNVWESYTSFLIKLDADGDSLFIRQFPFGYPHITETHDHHYCIGTDNFNYKMTRNGDSVWHKPAEITGDKQWIEGITATIDGSIYTISTEFDLENLGDPFGRIKQYDSLGDFVANFSFHWHYSYGLDIGTSPSGQVYGIASSQYGATPFFKKVGSPTVYLDTIPNAAFDLCILNDSMLFLLGSYDNKMNLLRLDQDGQVTGLAEDICPQPAYQLCKLNDSTLLIAGSDENGLRLSQVTAGLELTSTVVLQDYPGHAIRELVFASDQKVALVGDTGTVNLNKTMYVMGLDIPDYHSGIKDVQAEKPVIYPNPSNGIFHFDAKALGNIQQAAVFQMDGRIVPGCISYHNGRIMIDLSRNKRGIYILRLEVGANSFVEKLILK
jgi:hypothetical protein